MIWHFDPVALSFAGLTIHWYGILFASAIASGFYLAKYMFSYENKNQKKLDDLLFYVVIGVVVGARLAHCLFYEPQYYLANPLEIFAVWKGGLASHGGGLGAILGIYIYARRYQESFIWLVDRIIIPTALFGFFVRFANFLNSEIIGKPTNSAFAVVFERVDALPRHPAQLYESFGYLLIFCLLLILYFKTKLRESPGALLGVFLSTTFLVRFLVEFVKMPQASYDLGIALNTGQLLSLPFLLAGIGIVAFSLSRR
jgi:phosphatidylglycerol:prolipoprotein diacylglycerol transferase